MKLKVLNIDGSKGSTVNLDDSVFGIVPNQHVVHQAVISELSNSRQGTHSSKNRSAVRGGGKKPWKQKGRGVAKLAQLDRHYGKAEVSFLGLSHISTSKKLQKKCES